MLSLSKHDPDLSTAPSPFVLRQAQEDGLRVTTVGSHLTFSASW